MSTKRTYKITVTLPFEYVIKADDIRLARSFARQRAVNELGKNHIGPLDFDVKVHGK